MQHQFFRSHFQFLLLHSPPNEKKKSRNFLYTMESKKNFSHNNFNFERSFKWILPFYRNGTEFFYIHNKLKNKIFNQVQTWVKTMAEREFCSVQFFFHQLILVYDNFQSMEIAAKKLNKMKRKKKQPFSTFISGFEKKKLETGGWISTIKSRKRFSSMF